MCTYLTEQVAVEGSGKTADRWSRLESATVYFDHPVHAMVDHSLNIDFFLGSDADARRLAVELTPQSGRALAEAILRSLDSAPPELVTTAV